MRGREVAIAALLALACGGTEPGPLLLLEEHAGQPIAALAHGLADQLETAERALADGERTRAVRAVDDALRVVDVGTHAAEGAWTDRFAEAGVVLEEVRHALQVGRPEEALRTLRRARRELVPTLRHGGPATVRAGPGRRGARAFAGATLVNSRGEVLGELVAPADDGTFTAVLGGARDVLGFLDFGGTPVSLPQEQLVYGEDTFWGTTVVVWPEDAGVEELRARAVTAG